MVSGAAVAIAVPFISSTLERRRLRWEGDQRRFDELRALLDSAVARLTDARNLLYDAMRASGRGDIELVRQVSVEYRETTSEITKDNLRITVRVGEDAGVAQAHSRATSTCTGLEVELDAYVENPEGVLMLPTFMDLRDRIFELMEEVRSVIGV